MDLSIVIVNWNSKDYLRECLKSVFSETAGIEFEVIVIDSGSFDGCGDMLRDHFPSVRFIQSDQNLGFAKANNMAFRASKGRMVLFLNPDTEFSGPAIVRLYSEWEGHEDAGVFGAKLVNTDETIQMSCIQAFPTILNQLLDTEFLRRMFPRSRLWGVSPLYGESLETVEIDVISGACLLLSRELFEEVEMFTEDYFMYSEDVDLCLKARRAGRRNFLVPSAEVVHHGGTSSDQASVSSFSSVMMLESRWRFFRRTRSEVYGFVYRLSMMGVSAVRLLIATCCMLATSFSSDRLRWKAAVKKWWSRLRWALGLEKWVRDFGV
jgi:N-acetylglucosaminyl-diphospho-decaprenol L-rhamnosyltransferase